MCFREPPNRFGGKPAARDDRHPSGRRRPHKTYSMNAADYVLLDWKGGLSVLAGSWPTDGFMVKLDSEACLTAAFLNGMESMRGKFSPLFGFVVDRLAKQLALHGFYHGLVA